VKKIKNITSYYIIRLTQVVTLCLLFTALELTAGTISAPHAPSIDAAILNDGLLWDNKTVIANDYNASKRMQDFLRRGNLTSLSAIANRELARGADTPEIRSLYAIALAAQADVSGAEEQLNKARMEDNIYALYARAILLRIANKPEKAIKKIRAALAIDKNHPYPWNILGRIRFQQGKYKQAIANFTKAIELEPAFLPAYTNLGATYFSTGNIASSRKYFLQAIEINPNAYQAHQGLALVYESANRYGMAINELKKSLEIHANNLSAREKLAELQLNAGQYKEALLTGKKLAQDSHPTAYMLMGEAALHLGDIQKAQQYIEQSQDVTARKYYLLGFIAMLKGEHKLALKQMERSLEKDAKYFGAFISKAALKLYLGEKIQLKEDLKLGWGEQLDKLLYFLKGSVFAKSGDWKNAAKNWKAAENVISGFSMAGLNAEILAKGMQKKESQHLALGIIYYYRNLHQQALIEFNKALKLNQSSILSNYWAAQSYLKQGDRAKALTHLNQATQHAPNFFSALYAIGELNFLLNKPETAKQFYTRAVAVKKDAGLFLKLGLLNEKTQQYDEAALEYRKLIKEFPDLFLGYNQLAWLYAKRGIQLNEAMKLAQKANKLQPGNSSILDTIGWIHYQKKQLDKALENTSKANRIRAKQPDILYHLGAIYNAKGNKKMAKKFLEQALSISADFEGSKEALRLLGR